MKKFLIGLMVLLSLGALAFGAMNFVRGSGEVLWTNPSAAVSAGELVDLGNRYGVAMTDIASNAVGTVRVEGVFDLGRAETNAVTVDLPMFYSTATKVSVTPVTDKYVGVAVEAADVHTNEAYATAGTYKIAVELNAPRRPVGLASGSLGATGTATVVEGQITATVN